MKMELLLQQFCLSSKILLLFPLHSKFGRRNVFSEQVRCRKQVDCSLLIVLDFPNGPEQEARDASMEAEVQGKHFLTIANQWSDPVTHLWAYGYDAEEAIEKAWKLANAE